MSQIVLNLSFPFCDVLEHLEGTLTLSLLFFYNGGKLLHKHTHTIGTDFGLVKDIQRKRQEMIRIELQLPGIIKFLKYFTAPLGVNSTSSKSCGAHFDNRLCSNRDETFNQIKSEYSKLAQKECKTRYDWVGKVIHWEWCKILKLDHSTKWYLHKPESVQEN